MIYTITNGELSASVESLGAELISLKSEKAEYVWQGGAWKSHAPILFPACGRIVNNTYTYAGNTYHMGIHGFAKQSEFELREKSEDRLVLVLKDYPESYASFPFRFELVAEYALKGDTLIANFTVCNKDEKEMLYMFGWHPGFVLWGDGPFESFELDFGDVNCLTHHPTTDTKFISGAMTAYPIKDGKYKLCPEEIYALDALIFSETLGEVTISSPTTTERSIKVTWSDNLPYVAFWKWPTADTRYLCVEPWSGLPGDGVTPEVWENRLNRSLASGAEETFAYTVTCK